MAITKYTAIHQIGNGGQKRHDIALYAHNSLNYKIPKNKKYQQ